MKDQIALVTGASRGIGRAIALALAQRGAKVIGTATSEAGAAGIREALAPFGGDGLVLNVNDGAALDAAVDAIVKRIDGDLVGAAVADPAGLQQAKALLG